MRFKFDSPFSAGAVMGSAVGGLSGAVFMICVRDYWTGCVMLAIGMVSSWMVWLDHKETP